MQQNKSQTRLSFKIALVLICILLGATAVIIKATGQDDFFAFLPIVIGGTGTEEPMTPSPTETNTPTVTSTHTATATVSAPLPTPGITPSTTPTLTNTPTATATDNPGLPCDVEFEGPVLDIQDFIFVTGDLDTTVDIFDLTAGGGLIGSGEMEGPFEGHACEGFVAISVDPDDLIEGHVLAASSSDSSVDTTIVISASPTETPLPTTPTVTATNTPFDPFIQLIPSCGTPNTNPGDVSFNLTFIDWPTTESLTYFWEGIPEIVWQAGQHAGSFTIQVTKSVPQDEETYAVMAMAGGGWSDTELFYVPCTNLPTATPTITATPSPNPVDIVIMSQPQLVSTPPIVAYEPVQFSILITNTGGIDVYTQFFVDVYIDPDPDLILTTTIPVTLSSGYSSVSSLYGGESTVITITAPLGFTNQPISHTVYAFVDSLEQITESDETNNISHTPFVFAEVTPVATPSHTPTPDGAGEISGVSYTFEDDLIPQYRVDISVVDDTTAVVIATTQTDDFGFYQFNNLPVPATTYTLKACIVIDGQEWYGFRNGMVPPNPTAIIVMFAGACQ